MFQIVLNEKEIPDKILMVFSTLDTFDKDRLKVLVHKVLVYGEDCIEIMWKVDVLFVMKKAVKSYFILWTLLVK